MQKFSKDSNKTLMNSLAPTKMFRKVIVNENLITAAPQIKKSNPTKSKFTVLKKFSAGKIPAMAKTENQRQQNARKSNIPKTCVNNKSMPVNKIVLTEKPCLKKNFTKHRNASPIGEKLHSSAAINKVPEVSEVYCQTNESEILNPLFIVSDYKIITPSKSVVNEIEKLRNERVAKQLSLVANNTRKFQKHSQKEEQHLDDLNEFLDKCFISRKPTPKISDILEEDRRIIESMDELLQREKPKIESITDIRSRIKQKEQELLSLFNHY